MKAGIVVMTGVLFTVALAVADEVSVPLSVHQAVRKGVAGVECKDAPVTVGLPFAEGAVKEQNGRPALAVKGAAAYQFRTLRKHADGSVAWALADFQAEVEAGKVSAACAIVPGTGVMAGPDLAADKCETIEIETGVLKAVVRKKRFNLLDSVTVNGVPAIEPGKSAGLLCYGPDGKEYTAANDPGATVTIEENGPVRCVVLAEGAHRDAAGSEGHRRCFGWTVRMHFYKGSDQVRLFHTLRNGSKEQLEDAETRGVVVSLAVQGLKSARAATADGATALDLPARAVQGRNGFPMAGVKALTAQQTGNAVGFSLAAGGKEIVKAGDAQSLGPDLFWLDAASPEGAGVAAGIRFAMGWFPKAISADKDALKVECWPKDNPPGYFFRFGAHATTEILLVFHAKPLADIPDRMNRFQYRLIAKAPVEQVNAADVFPLRLDRWVTYRQELDTYKKNALFVKHNYDTESRMGDRVRPQFQIWRYHYWGSGGGLNQADFARVALVNGLRMQDNPQVAGQMYLEGEQRFLYNSDFCVQHYDDFSAADACVNPYSSQHSRKDAIHLHDIKAAPINNSKVVFEFEHPHWCGMLLYYYTTGDERFRRAIRDWSEIVRASPMNAVPNYTRFFGWGMRSLTEMDQFLGDRTFLDLADKGRDNLLRAYKEKDGQTILGHNWDRGFTIIQEGGQVEAGMIGCKPFMDGYIVWGTCLACFKAW